MMNMISPLAALVSICLASAAFSSERAVRDPVDWVDPTIGATSHMLVPAYPTVSLPFGMYRFATTGQWFLQDEIQELPLFLPSHRAGGLFGMSFVSTRQEGLRLRRPSGLGSGRVPVAFTLDQKVVTPYSFSATVDSHDIVLKLVPTAKGAIIRFSGGGYSPEAIRFNAANVVRDGNVVRLSAPFKGLTAHLYGAFGGSDRNEFRFAVSWISSEQAARNFAAEVKDRSLEEVESAARQRWNAALGRIRVEGGTDAERKVFYTAFYRCHERMVEISEEGQCRGWDGAVHPVEGRRYTDDWSWDTYRAAHPLFCILDPEMQRDRLNSYLAMASETPEGWVPTFPNVAGDGHNMNAFHPASLFLDAYVKGVTGVDWKAAWKALVHTERTASRLPWYRGPRTPMDAFHDAHGYFPALQPDEPETDWPEGLSTWEKRQPVAVTLGYAYDAWCLAELGRRLGMPSEGIAEYARKATFDRNLFHPETKFFHPKDARGDWIRDVDYTRGGGLGARQYYDENNGWTYRWDAPHDIAWLVAAHGGNAAFVKNLDELFNAPTGCSPWEYLAVLPDSTGRIGQFVAGNEPSFHIPYLYNFAGAPQKTQKRIRQILEAWFRADAMGLPGDEDGGGMSAFVVFSMMGFYPVTPGLPEYQIGSPVFSKVTIDLPNGKTFVIDAPAASRTVKYWHAATLGGCPLKGTVLPHAAVVAGETLSLDMTSDSVKR